MWYCVIRIRDDRLLYLGEDEDVARILSADDGHVETAERRGDAERRGAIAAAKKRRARNQPKPPFSYGR